MPYRKRRKLKPGLKFVVGDAWDSLGEPYVMPGSIVEAIGLPGDTVFVNGRGYEVKEGKLALRVVEGTLAERRDLRGQKAIGFCFQQHITTNEEQLKPLCEAARDLCRRVLESVGSRNA
jgi:hypothetical protein